VPSYRITDAQLHALVGDGAHGRGERIQTLRCQACGTMAHAPHYAALSAQNCIPPHCRSADRAGTRLSVAAATRVFGHRHATITRWLTRAGAHSALIHERFGERLHLPHLQLDELRTRLRTRTHVLWLWLALDPLTKIMVVLHLGARTQAAAHAMVHELHGRLASGCLPVFTSDTLNLYFYALTAHFGQWVAGVGRRARRWQVAAQLIYGQVKKRYRRRRLVGVTYVLRCSPCAALHSALTRLGLSGKLNTAFVERVKKDSAPKRGGAHPLHLVDGAGGSAAAPRSGVVAGLLSLRAAT
jgi:transposase-like protein